MKQHFQVGIVSFLQQQNLAKNFINFLICDQFIYPDFVYSGNQLQNPVHIFRKTFDLIFFVLINHAIFVFINIVTHGNHTIAVFQHFSRFLFQIFCGAASQAVIKGHNDLFLQNLIQETHLSIKPCRSCRIASAKFRSITIIVRMLLRKRFQVMFQKAHFFL